MRCTRFRFVSDNIIDNCVARFIVAISVSTAVSVFVLTATPAGAAGVPQTINYQGRLTDPTGAPVADSIYGIAFSIYDMSTGGALLWTETQNVITFKGLFTARLGAVTPIPTSIFGGANRWLGIRIAGESSEILPRAALGSSPYVFTAGQALGADWSGITNAPQTIGETNSCADGEILVWNNATQTWICAPKPTSPSPTLSDLSCAAGEIPSFNGSTWQCAPMPTSAIESGIASTHVFAFATLVCDSMSDIATVTITTPASGVIYLTARATVDFSGTTQEVIGDFQIDETQGGNPVNPYYLEVGLNKYPDTIRNYFPVFVDRTYSKPAGTYTFRFEGRSCSFDSAASTKAFFASVTAMYFPAGLGAITVSSKGTKPQNQLK